MQTCNGIPGFSGFRVKGTLRRGTSITIGRSRLLRDRYEVGKAICNPGPQVQLEFGEPRSGFGSSDANPKTKAPRLLQRRTVRNPKQRKSLSLYRLQGMDL